MKRERALPSESVKSSSRCDLHAGRAYLGNGDTCKSFSSTCARRSPSTYDTRRHVLGCRSGHSASPVCERGHEAHLRVAIIRLRLFGERMSEADRHRTRLACLACLAVTASRATCYGLLQRLVTAYCFGAVVRDIVGASLPSTS
jgi:hypothetical protein